MEGTRRKQKGEIVPGEMASFVATANDARSFISMYRDIKTRADAARTNVQFEPRFAIAQQRDMVDRLGFDLDDLRQLFNRFESGKKTLLESFAHFNQEQVGRANIEPRSDEARESLDALGRYYRNCAWVQLHYEVESVANWARAAIAARYHDPALVIKKVDELISCIRGLEARGKLLREQGVDINGAANDELYSLLKQLRSLERVSR
jgi:hypothetical protein